MRQVWRSALAVGLIVATTVSGVALAKPGKDKDNGRANGRAKHTAAFADWQSDFWANEALARMSVKGVLKGYADGTIGAGRTVSKAEAAVMLVRLLGMEGAAQVLAANPDLSVNDVLYGQGEAAGQGQLQTGGHLPGGKWELEVDGEKLEFDLKQRGQIFELKADAEGQVTLKTKGRQGKEIVRFADSQGIPDWGRGAIYAALQNDFLFWEGDRLCISCPVNRLEATIMLVKAAGLGDAARARTGVALNFSDAAAIPEWARGYVALALENGFISGYPDGTFQPFRPVTRAEWAALLDRLDRTATVSPDARQVKGTVTGVNVGASPSVSLTTPAYPQGVTYAVDDTATFYVGGQEATLADVRVSDRVLVQLSPERRILMLTVVTVREQVQGTVVGFVAPQGGAAGSITLRPQGDRGSVSPAHPVADVSYAVSPAATVWLDGRQTGFGEVHVGDQAGLQLERGQAVRITLKSRPNHVTGTIAAVLPGTNATRPRILLTAATAGALQSGYEVADWVQIIAANGAALTLADLQPGMVVELELKQGLVVRISVKSQPVPAELREGVVSAVFPVTIEGAEMAISIVANGASQTYAVASNVTVRWGNGSLAFADLQVGDRVRLALTGQRVTQIDVLARATAVPVSLQGSVITVDQAGQQLRLQYTPAGATSRTETTVRWNAATTFTYQGLRLTPASLAVGQQLAVTGHWQADSSLLASAVTVLGLGNQ